MDPTLVIGGDESHAQISAPISCCAALPLVFTSHNVLTCLEIFQKQWPFYHDIENQQITQINELSTRVLCHSLPHTLKQNQVTADGNEPCLPVLVEAGAAPSLCSARPAPWHWPCGARGVFTQHTRSTNTQLPVYTNWYFGIERSVCKKENRSTQVRSLPQNRLKQLKNRA